MSKQDTREHMDNGVSVQMCPNGSLQNLARHSKASQVFSDGFSDGQNEHETVRQDELSDTREQLEAELRDELRLVFGGNGGQRYASYKFVQSLLDRQDAITQREFAKAQEKSTLEVMRADAKLRKEITELIADLETYRKYAEQGECDNCGTVESETSKVPESDSREQLEADIDCEIEENSKGTNAERSYTRKLIIGWLDRQAAITKAECEDDAEFDCMTCFRVGFLQQDVDRLTAERDELQAAIDAMENGQFYAMYKAKRDECEQLKKVVRTQAESFKKLECELAGKQ